MKTYIDEKIMVWKRYYIEPNEKSELPTHAKAMGWASGFNGRAT